MKVLGIQIANGFSPEARVHAALLGSRGMLFDAMAIKHDSPVDRESANQFEATSKVQLVRIDTGWRRSEDAGPALFRRARFLIRFVGAVSEMVTIARTYNPDVVYSCQQQWDCRAATAVARRLGKPQIIHLHCVITQWLRKQPLKRLLTVDHVVTVSDFIRNEALRHGVAPNQVTTILNSVPSMPLGDAATRAEVRGELGLPIDAPVVGIVARICAGKGHADTIEAFSRAARQCPQAILVVVGDGPMETEIKALAADGIASGRIIFTGPRNDVPRVLSALDIFIHPSFQEACSLALMEASVASLPVVAYAEGGTPELIADGRTGLLAPSADVDRLTDALADLLANPDKAKAYGAAGRERMLTQFRPDQASAAFAAILKSTPQIAPTVVATSSR